MAIAGVVSVTSLRADEGMWLLNAPPVQRLKDAYGFEPTPAWLEHVQKSSVRFNNGGSGSFITADGLIITNHHVGADAVQKLSSAEHNYLRDGFYAKTRADELKCKDLELNVLISIEDVTDKINAAVKPGATAAEAFAARRAAKSAIEKESLAKTGLRSDVVTLYQGGQYHLYRYKRYTDVRLVFAPEQQAAFFGGDPDNFEFPRFDLDITLVRAYENGQPAKIDHYFKVQPKGAGDNELVFVSGHPGSTSRLLTSAELAFMRDVRVPTALGYIKMNEVALTSWSARSKENARRARDDLFSFQNSRKVYDGRIAALLDHALFDDKAKEEGELQAFAKTRPDLAEALEAWPKIAAAQQIIGEHYLKNYFIEATAFDSSLVRLARGLYRSVVEKAKPSGDRLREYRDSNLPSLELELFSEEPIYDDFEQVKLTQALIYATMQLGVNDPAIRLALGGKGPQARASELILGTKVKDVAFRKRLYAMTPDEMAKVDDPLIAFVRTIDPIARAERKVIEEQNEAKEQAHAKIEKVRYAKYGTSVYPDATFTLRLSFGVIKGYEELGKHIAPFSTLGGTYERSAEHDNREPFDLPESWVKAKGRLGLGVPFNFVSTCDIIGGNSGSPTINKVGEFVGIIFDGNIYSLVADYGYSDVQSRALSVDIRAILETLKNVYGADALVAEMLQQK
ncbi:serine protease [Opitutaceae bacterium EW11]|nr:serine protease [Opitutaceae bacterium EW11]